MAKILVVYDSKSRTTEAMARAVAEGVGEGAVLRRAEETGRDELLSADGIVLGSPCYYGSMAASVKQALEKITPDDLGKLEGKVGGAFSSSLFVGGGNELAIMSMIHFLMAQGMIVQGVPLSDHFGPVSVGKPTDEVLEKCRNYGARVGALARRIAAARA
jgi:NAD(P)H dehydrogenase (quinone)